LVETHKDIDFVLVFGGLFLMADVFAVDLMLPLEIVVGIPYGVVVLLGLFWPGRSYIYTAAVLCSLLTGLGVYLAPPKQELMELALDRGSSLFVIWLVAGICLAAKRVERKKEELGALIGSVCRVQSQSLAKSYDPALFKNVLNSLLKLTSSEIGVVCEVTKTADGEAGFKPVASVLANGTLGESVLDLYNRPSTHGVEIYSMDALLDEVVATGRPLHINDSVNDGGSAAGHPLLHSFMGLPFYHGGQVLGVVGLANRPGGYPEEFGELLKPFLFTFANILLFMKKEAEPGGFREQMDELEARLQTALDEEKQAQEDLSDQRQKKEAAQREKREMEQAFAKSIEQLKTLDREREETARNLEGTRARLKEVEGELAHWEEAMHRGEEDLKRLAQSTGGWFWEMNAQGLYTYASSGVEKVLGFKAGDIAGRKHFYDLFVEEKREALKAEFFALIERGEPLSRLVSEKSTSEPGRTVFVETIGIPVLDATGEVVSYQGIECDVSEREGARRDLEIERLRSRGVLQAAGEGIYGVDAEGRVTFVNDALLDMLGYSAEELKGEPQSLFLCPLEGEEGVVDGSAFIAGKKKIETKARLRCKDRSHLDARLTSLPLKEEGRLVGAVVSLGARAEASPALPEAPAEKPARAALPQGLPGEVAEGFLDGLRKIVAFGRRLREKYSDRLDDRGRDYLERLNRAAGHMQASMDDWSVYRQVGAAGRPLKPVPLGEVVEEVVSLMQPYISRQEGVVRIGEMPTLLADRAEMHQLFKHLIANALKYHKENIAPAVSIHARPGEEGCIEILVADNGIGIDGEVPGGGEAPEASGMGLAICARIVKHHGGTMNVRGIKGKGTTVTLTFPGADSGAKLD